MASLASADRFIAWIFFIFGKTSTRVSYLGGQDTLILSGRIMFEEDVFDAPETTGGKGCDFL
jgi:hypothetical protein